MFLFSFNRGDIEKVLFFDAKYQREKFLFFPERDHKKDGFLFLSSGKVLEKKVLFFSDKTLKKKFLFFRVTSKINILFLSSRTSPKRQIFVPSPIGGEGKL